MDNRNKRQQIHWTISRLRKITELRDSSPERLILTNLGRRARACWPKIKSVDWSRAQWTEKNLLANLLAPLNDDASRKHLKYKKKKRIDDSDALSRADWKRIYLFFGGFLRRSLTTANKSTWFFSVSRKRDPRYRLVGFDNKNLVQLPRTLDPRSGIVGGARRGPRKNCVRFGRTRWHSTNSKNCGTRCSLLYFFFLSPSFLWRCNILSNPLPCY